MGVSCPSQEGKEILNVQKLFINGEHRDLYLHYNLTLVYCAFPW